MRTLNDREKRTIRIAAIGLGVYLLFYLGLPAWNYLADRRAEYRALLTEAENLRKVIEPYDSKVAHVKKLMEEQHLDPAKLSRDTVVAGASAAIQKAAASTGIQVGPIRESPARSSSKELASVQFEGTGQAKAVLALLHRMGSLGYPLLIDSVQLTAEPARPGQVKLTLTVVILDFEQWKAPEVPHA